MPVNLTMSCYWIAEKRGHNSIIPVQAKYPKGFSCDVHNAFQLDLMDNTSFVRNNGKEFGMSNQAGEYRGFIISVHDSTGKKVACGSNLPGLCPLAP